MGKFSDKFLKMLSIDDDEIIDDYEGYDDEPDTPKKKSVFTSKPKDPDDDFEEPPTRVASKPVRQNTKVVPLTRPAAKASMEVCVIKPSTVEEGREITDTLLSGRAVILNLEGLHTEVAQRIVDFTSGSCYSIRGNLQKISNYIIIITPESVEISGDFQDLLSGGFDVSTFK